MIISLISSLLFIGLGNIYPQISVQAVRVIDALDFHNLLMKVMLSFLLFAGAIHINAQSLKKEGLPILTFATVGTILSTFIVGGLMFFVFKLFHLPIGFIY